MASRAQQLHQKISQSDALIKLLRRQMAMIKINSTANELELEEKALQAENDALTQKVNSMKIRLADLEKQNGLQQVPLPNQSNVKQAMEQPPSIQPAVAAKNEVKKTEKTKPEISKERQQSKKEPKKEKAAPAKKDGDGASSGGDAVDVSRLDLRIGEIVDVKLHPDADSLYMETVNVGEDKPRTILSGLVKHIPIEEMRGRRAVFLCNLKPAKMRGILSEGMIMCGSLDEKVEIIEVPDTAVAGDLVTVEGYPRTPDTQLNPKKKIFEKLKPDLLIDGQGFATYKSAKWLIEGKGHFKTKTLVNAQIS